ncbi:hypothetical protein HHK36_001805 [Tetracentron sinense]|uniref:Uncharacterized protein n=1 Tax=Tetracentron sinense TaxID=13715 RepID=A0A835A4D8_TETSI|nr:hypothetical protein HHK36_001805 [Tetracentron sinense]
MDWEKEYLDAVLVPSGLFIMFSYHVFLLYRCLRLPHTTVIGYENHHKSAWVERMMQADTRNIPLALQVISGNTSAATVMSSVCIALSSLIGAWIGSSSKNTVMSGIIYGDTRQSTVFFKYISLLTCFLVAFASFVQSARYFVHANFLISVPDTDIPVKYVQSAVIMGSSFWSVGHRSLYFATTLLLWIFGPIPMFVCSVIMVLLLNFLDTNSTPLHQYSSPTYTNQQLLIKRVGEQITTSVATDVELH